MEYREVRCSIPCCKILDQSPSKKRKEIKEQLDYFKGTLRTLKSTVGTKHEIDAKLNENKLLQTELSFVKKEDKIYKKLGPVLIEQDLEEAKRVVSKRVLYLSAEQRRLEEAVTQLGYKCDKHKQRLDRIQSTWHVWDVARDMVTGIQEDNKPRPRKLKPTGQKK